MGFFGDFFGGQAKVRALPPALRELAANSKEASDQLYNMFSEGASRGLPWANMAEGYARDAISDLGPAKDFARRMGQDAMDMYSSRLMPLADKSFGEIYGAGSDGRIAQERSRAYDDYMAATSAAMEQQERMAGRYGFGGAGSPFNTQTAISRAAGAASAANQAGFRERAYGEGLRLNALPNVLAERQNALSFAQQPAAITQQQMGLSQQGGTAYSNIMGSTLPFATTGTNVGQTAFDMNNKNFEFDLFRDQQNANRRSNMLETGLNVAGMAFGLPGVGSAFRGGAGGGIYGGVLKGGGGNPWGTFKMPDWLSGGGGGAAPPSGFGASGRYYPR